MNLLASSVLAVIISIIIIFYVWRYATKVRIIPCPHWLKWLVEIDNPLTKNNKAQFIIDFSNVEAGMNVIDFGCGPGRLSVPLALKVGKSGKVVAVDVQNKMLAEVKQKAEQQKLHNLEFLQAEISSQTLNLADYDQAFLINVLGETSISGGFLHPPLIVS